MQTPLSLLFNRTQRAIGRHTTSNSKTNLVGLKASVLMMLENSNGSSFGEVARTLGATPPRLSELAHRMEDEGLIAREIDPKDGRARRLILTARGEEARGEAVRASSDINALMTENFTDEEISTVVRWLEAVRERCDNSSNQETA